MFLSPIAEESPPPDFGPQCMTPIRSSSTRRQSIGVNIPVNHRPDRGSTNWLPPSGLKGTHVIRAPTTTDPSDESENNDAFTSIFKQSQTRSNRPQQNNNNPRQIVRRRSPLGSLPNDTGSDITSNRRASLPKRRRSTLVPLHPPRPTSQQGGTTQIVSVEGIKNLNTVRTYYDDFSHLPSYMRPTQASLGWRRDKVSR